MKIRKAREGDLKEIAKIFYEEATKKPYSQDYTLKSALKKVDGFLKKEDLVLMEDKGQPIGFIVVRVNKDRKDIYIEELWFTKRNQGKGLGRKLVSFVQEKYKSKGYKTISVMAHQKAKALGFYKKLKFKEKLPLVFLKKELK